MWIFETKRWVGVFWIHFFIGTKANDCQKGFLGCELAWHIRSLLKLNLSAVLG